MHGRINSENILKSADKNSRCYFVGRPAIAENLEELCRRRGMTLVIYKDTNGRESQQDSVLLVKYLKIRFRVLLFILPFVRWLVFLLILRASRDLFNTAFLTRRVCCTEGRDCSIAFELGLPVFIGMEQLDPV